MHFAGRSQVGESMARPGEYYRSNLAGTLALLDAMAAAEVRCLIQSSTAAIFGEPREASIDEHHPVRPLSPYGRSKWMVEEALADYELAHELRYTCLRYFNAAGADPAGRLGERHEPETHLIPLVLQVASGRRAEIRVYGTDYDTRDGTCVRDYIHVEDLCRAHLLALERLLGGARSARYNLGNGNGFSVKEVIATAAQVTGRPIAQVVAGRRPGDPARLVANAALARRELGWEPRYPDLAAIIGHAWNWETRPMPKPSHAPDAKRAGGPVKIAPDAAQSAQANEFARRSGSGTEVAAENLSKKRAARA
jgi:UDP-glucose 4-epimerase